MNLLETSCKICFSSIIDPEIIYGMVYSSIKDKFATSEKTPIAQLPLEIRDNDSNFKWMPTHIFKNHQKQQALSVGGRVFIFTQMNESVDSFKTDFAAILNEIEQLNIWNSIVALEFKTVRLGNPSEINQDLNFSVMLGQFNLNAFSFHFQSELDYNDFINTIIITNTATVQNQDKNAKFSILDIATRTKSTEGQVDILASIEKLKEANAMLLKDFLK